MCQVRCKNSDPRNRFQLMLYHPGWVYDIRSETLLIFPSRVIHVCEDYHVP